MTLGRSVVLEEIPVAAEPAPTGGAWRHLVQRIASVGEKDLIYYVVYNIYQTLS